MGGGGVLLRSVERVNTWQWRGEFMRSHWCFLRHLDYAWGGRDLRRSSAHTLPYTRLHTCTDVWHECKGGDIYRSNKRHRGHTSWLPACLLHIWLQFCCYCLMEESHHSDGNWLHRSRLFLSRLGEIVHRKEWFYVVSVNDTCRECKHWLVQT